MKRKNFLLALAMVLLVQLLSAQDSTKTIKVPKNTIKWSYLSLFDLTPSIQFAYEHRLTPMIGLQIEAGYINSHIFNYEFITEDFYKMRGYRIRAEIRSYVLGKGFYFAPELLYKHTWFYRTDDIGIDCNTIDCAYFQRLTFKIHKWVYAFHPIRFGRQGQFSYSKLSYDFYTGIGARYVFLQPEGIPLNASFTNENWELYTNRSEGYYLRPSISLGVKLGYMLN